METMAVHGHAIQYDEAVPWNVLDGFLRKDIDEPIRGKPLMVVFVDRVLKVHGTVRQEKKFKSVMDFNFSVDIGTDSRVSD